MRPKLVLEKAKEEGFALTYDDVRLRTGYSDVMPDEANLESRFSRNVGLKIPVVSAAMDTVTEYRLAIELAKLGGIGVIHRSLSPEEQAFQVSKVKNYLNARIEKPICVYEDEKIEAILNKKESKGYNFHSFPVLNRQNKLIGIITETDFELCENNSLIAKEIMSTNIITADAKRTIDEAYEIMRKYKKKVLPLVNEKGEIAGMYSLSDVKRIRTQSARDYNLDGKGRLIAAAAVGVGEGALERVASLARENVDVIVIDTAHADSKAVIETLQQIKKDYPVDVVVGNIAVAEAAQRLAKEGADGIKVGIGPGSICTTRMISGVGKPQLSAVYECVQKIEESKLDIPICADGGIKYSGDIAVAIAGGAHSVMLGKLLAGTEEAPGKITFWKGRQWKDYRGMGSIGAMEGSRDARERYLQNEYEKNKLVPEGVEGLEPYKGKLESVIVQNTGGLRRGMGYVGAKNIEELRQKGDFDRITPAGLSESHPHDIMITKDAPNYRRE